MSEMFTTIGGSRVPICSDCYDLCRPDRFYSVEASYWSDDDDGAFPLSPFYSAFLCEDCFSRNGSWVVRPALNR
jgi:hypothetical protein